jgi:succinate dehydrogenase / fumarate reductase cytochrome b subunit
MSGFFESLTKTLSGYVRYRGREGHISFLLHRITGLGTLLFLIIHILDTSLAYFRPEFYQHAIELYAEWYFMIGEIILVFCVIYHGVNGLRIAYLDLFKPEAWTISAQRKAARWTLTASLVLWLPAAGIMGYRMLHESLGWI